MDLHRLRVVEFDTSTSGKERKKKYMVEHEECKHEECKQEDWKTSPDEDETGDDNQCIDDDMSPPGLSTKCLDDKISPPGTWKKYLDDKISPPGTWKKYLDDTASPPVTSKKCPYGNKCPPGTSEKYLDYTTSTSPPGIAKKDNCACSKTKSEIFKIPHKNNARTSNLKINSSDIGLTKLFRDSAYLHQKKRTSNLRNRNSRLHRKVENVKEKKEKNEHVHVLFARETPSFIKYCQKRAKSQRTITKKKRRDSELPNNIYGFQKSTRSKDQHHYRMSCFNFIDTDKTPFNKLRRGLHRKPTPPQTVQPSTSCACKHHAMRVLNSACAIGQRPSIYYSLGTRPRRSQRKHDNDQEEGMKRELSNSIVKDETVEVSPTSHEFVSISYRDACTGSSKVGLSAVCRRRRSPCAREYPVLQNVTITSERNQEPCPLPYTPKPGAAPAQNKGKTKRNEMKKTKFITNVPLGFISRVARQFTGFQTKKGLTGESCIKYVFFGLLIVAWSPCLLAVFVAWVVMFPVKLTSILKINRFRKKDPLSEYQRIYLENYFPKNKKSFMASATSWYSRTVGSVANTLTSLFRLKKKSPTGAASSFLPSSHPNPRKKYTLFYADNRGWVMKPLRRKNTRPSASTRVVQKACPVHKVNSKPWRKSTAAEVVYPLQGTRQRAKCNCWNKYPQGSSMFSRRPHYHQRLQVNIPPTVCYPMFGIAFNSPNRTINAKQINSTGITDNIAHEDLAKYHLGQRKNGILPYGVIVNHPRRSKLPLIKNLETSRSHKFSLAGKTLNMSKKCTPRIVIKGLQGPKCRTKHEAGKPVIKSPGVHKIISLIDVTNNIPTKHISSYRQNNKREEALIRPSGGNRKSVMKNKKLQTLRKNLNFRNKCVLADLPRSTENKQANTSIHKIKYAHKTQNIPKQILKVSENSRKKEKAKPYMASKCAKHTPPKQAYTYKSDKTCVPTRKHSSPAKIKSSISSDTVLNYSFRKKQEYKYNPDQIPVATQQQSNKSDNTANTIPNKDLNYPSGEKHKQTKLANKYIQHQVRPVATQKQSNKAENTTKANRDVVFNCLCEDKHGLNEHCCKNELHQRTNATQMQSRTVDNTTMTNYDYLGAAKPSTVMKNIASTSRKFDKACSKDTFLSGSAETRKHEQIKKNYKRQTCVDLNYFGAVKHSTANKEILCVPITADKDTICTHRIWPPEYASRKQDVSIQNYERSKTKEIVHPEHNALLKQADKYKTYKTNISIQKQPSTADIMTSMNRDIALNCPCGEKHEQYIPHQVSVASQKQPSTANTNTMTNRDITLSSSRGEKHKQCKRVYKCQPHNVALNFLGAVKPNTANKEILCIPITADKNTICTQIIWPTEYVPKKQDISTQKHVSKVETSVYCAIDYERNKIKEMVCPEQTVFAKKNVHCASTSCEKIGSLKQASSFKKVTDWGWGWGLYKGTRTHAPVVPQENKCEVEAKSAQTALIKDHHQKGESFSTCRTILANRTENKLANQLSRQKPLFVGRSLDVRGVSTTQELSTRQNRTDDLLKQFQPDANSLFGISSNCRYGLTPQITQVATAIECLCNETSEHNVPDMKMGQIASDSKITILYESTSAKSPAIHPSTNRDDKALDKIIMKKTETPALQSITKLPEPEHVPPLEETKTPALKSITNLPEPEHEPPLEETKTPALKSITKLPEPEHEPPLEETKTPALKSITKLPEPEHVPPLEETETPALKSITKIPEPEPTSDQATAHIRKTHILTETPPTTSTDIKDPCDCTCDCNSAQRLLISLISKIDSLRRISQAKQSSLRAPETTLGTDGQPEFSQHFQSKVSQATSPVAQLNERNQTEKIETHSKKTNTTSAKAQQQTDWSQASSHTLQKQPKLFGICSDCKRRKTQSTAAGNILNSKSLFSNALPHKCPCSLKSLLGSLGEQPFGSKVSTTSSKKNVRKVDKSRSKFPKSPDHSLPAESMPRKCLCPVDTLQDPVGEQPYGNILNSKSLFSNALPHKCPCSLKSLLGSLGEQPYGSKVNTTSSKKNVGKVDKSRSKFPKSPDHSPPAEFMPHKCRCPVDTLQDPVGEQPYGNILNSKSPNRNALPYKCPCPLKSLLGFIGEQPYGAKVSKTSPKRNVLKVDKTLSKFPKSPPESMPRKCRCPVVSPQDSVGDQPFGTKVSLASAKRNVIIDKTRSKFPNSPDHSPPPEYMPRKCRCPVVSTQNPVGDQPHGTKVRSTSAKRNVVIIDKTRSKFPNSPDHSPPPESMPRKCRCAVDTLHDHVGEKTYGTKVSTTSSKKNMVKIDKTRSKCPKSFCPPPPKSLLHKSRYPVENLQDPIHSIGVFEQSCCCTHSPSQNNSLHDCPCLQNMQDSMVKKRSHHSLKYLFSRPPKDERSKVSRLVMSLRCKLFRSKLCKQTKIPENSTKNPRSVILSSSQVNPKKVDKSQVRLLQHGQQSKTLQGSSFHPYLSNTSCPNEDTEKISHHARKPVLGDESNRSLFRPSHIMSKTSQNAYLANHSSQCIFHNSCSHVIHQSSSKQCKQKNRNNVCKPLLRDKSYSCLRVSNTSQRPSLSHSSKLDFRYHDDNTSCLRLSKISCYSYPKLSQPIRRQHSKTCDHSSSVKSRPIECTSDKTFSTPKDRKSHPILNTLFKRNSHSKSQHLSQRNTSQFTAYFNRSQEPMTQCLSHRIIPGMCSARHLGKTTSQSNSRPKSFNNNNRSRTPTSAQKGTSKKFNPQYTSSLNNHQPTPTAKAVPSQLPLSPEPLTSRLPESLFNSFQPKPLIEKIRSITGKISSNSLKNKQEKTSSTVGAQTAITFRGKYACWPEKLHQLSKKLSEVLRKSVENTSQSETQSHLPNAQSTQTKKNSNQARVGNKALAKNPQHALIRQPDCQHHSRVHAQLSIPKIYSLHHSSRSKQLTEKVEKEFDAILQQPKAEPVTPNLSGKGERKMKTEYSSSNKLQPNIDLQKLPSDQPSRSPNSHNILTDTHRLPSSTASHSTRKSIITSMQPELSQHLSNQPLETPASKFSQSHPSHQADIPYKTPLLHDSYPKRKKPCKCRISKYGNEQEIPKSLPTIAKTQSPGISHYSLEKPLHNSNMKRKKPCKCRISKHGIKHEIPNRLHTIAKTQFSGMSHYSSEKPLNNSYPKRKKPCKCRISKQGNEQEIPKSLHTIAKTQSPGKSHYFSKKPSHNSYPKRKKPCKCRISKHRNEHEMSNNLHTIAKTQTPEMSHYSSEQPLHNFLTRPKKPCKCRISKNGNELEIPNSLHTIAKTQSPGMSQYSSEQPLHNFLPRRKKPCKCRISKNGNELEIPNSLHTIAKTQSPEMSQKRLRGHIIQRSEISQSSKNPQFPPSPQTRLYQQNLQHQRESSQIQVYQQNLQLLQRNLPGLGRTGTAEGGLLHPHPDFNRVPMYYPGPNSTYKQSKPGRQQFTVYNQFEVANLGCDPYYTIPANQCALNTVPYSESALRHAYKRRPLRCTPPREHLPRVVMEKRLKENKKQAAMAKLRRAKRCGYKRKSLYQCVRDSLIQTDREAWPEGIKCHQMWVNALKKRPCFWIFKTCPSVYPSFLNFYKCQQYLRQMFVYLLTICFWSPLAICCYFCCECMPSPC